MKAFLPVTIGASQLTSSSVVETATEYNSGTTYALGDTVGVTASDGTVTAYQSLQNANTGNSPATSAAWWKNIGDTYAAWNSGTTYALGYRVLDATTHKVYESLQAANLNHAVTDTDWWAFVGPTNKWAMFTYDHSLKSSAPSPITFTITPGQRVNAIQFTGVTATSVHVVATSVTGGGTVYDRTITMRTHNGSGWWRWLWGGFRYRSTAARFDLPSYSDIVIAVTVTNGDGDAVVGKCGVGLSVYIGTVETGVRSRPLRASIIQRDEFNELTLVKRRTAPEKEEELWAEKRYFQSIDKFSNDSDAEPVFWSGLEESEDLYSDSLCYVGIATVFDVDMQSGWVHVNLTTQGI